MLRSQVIKDLNDIRMKGIEFLGGVCISAALNIKPKTRINKLDALKELMRAWGLNPEQVLSREALSQGNITVIDRAQLEQAQITQLTVALKQQMIREIKEGQVENRTN